jgi:hypothetical protein
MGEDQEVRVARAVGRAKAALWHRADQEVLLRLRML